MLRAILYGKVDYSILTKLNVSEDAIAFLPKMLCIDGTKRITAADCLPQTWLRDVEDVQAMPREADHMIRMGLEFLQEQDELGLSESFGQAAAGLIDPPAEIPATENADDQEISSSQWSPRDPQPVTTAASDSDELLADVQNNANEIANGASPDVAAIDFAAADFLDDCPVQTTERASFDSLYDANDNDDRSMIVKLDVQHHGTAPNGHNTRARPERLFGEVTTSGFGESGIFGPGDRPQIQGDGHEHRTYSLQGAERQMSSLNMSAGESRKGIHVSFNALPSKRLLELSDTKDDSESASKRSMTSNYRRPIEIRPANAKSKSERKKPLLGILIPLPGSFSDVRIDIHDQVMTWGRFKGNTDVFKDQFDTRVPKCGIDITFSCPGMYEAKHVRSDWQSMRDLDAVIMTRATNGIHVNGVKLTKACNGRTFKCGILRTGDIVEVSPASSETFLKFRCEFYIGRSAATRGADEPFVVEENTELSAAAAALLEAKSAAQEVI